MLFFLYGYVFLVGSVLGSFFNVVGLRIPLKQSISRPRSACPKCGHTLKPWELIPILSFLIQKGKCSRCKARISPLYPIVEMITGLLFIMAPITFGWTFELIIAWTLISLLMIIFVSDVAYMLIPDKVLLFFAAVFFVERLYWPLSPWWDSLLGAGVAFLLLLIIAIISQGGMGGGDIKLFALLGFVLGTKLVLLAFFVSTFFGAVIGIIGMLFKVVKKGEPIPFGPFIVAGTLTVFFYGEYLIQLYLQLI